jgi:hypothetical protein
MQYFIQCKEKETIYCMNEYFYSVSKYATMYIMDYMITENRARQGNLNCDGCDLSTNLAGELK